MTLIWIIASVTLGSLLALLVASSFLFLPERLRTKALPLLISYATGTLLGAAFLGVLPPTMEALEPSRILGVVLAGLLLFFLLEKFVLWRHCHKAGCDSGHSSAGPLILFGDAFHNFVDGILIAAAFQVSIPLGVTTTFAIVSHEVPQELGDMAILVHSGYSRRKALIWNGLSAAAALLGALLGYWFMSEIEDLIPYVMALAASSFIYIAIADLVPSLHKHTNFKQGLSQIVFILLGVGTIYFFHAADHIGDHAHPHGIHEIDRFEEEYHQEEEHQGHDH